jgi:hypothetical protein
MERNHRNTHPQRILRYYIHSVYTPTQASLWPPTSKVSAATKNHGESSYVLHPRHKVES